MSYSVDTLINQTYLHCQLVCSLSVSQNFLALTVVFMIDQMSKTIKKLEKENIALKKKSEKSDVTVIDLLDEASRTSIPHVPPTSSRIDNRESVLASCSNQFLSAPH